MQQFYARHKVPATRQRTTPTFLDRFMSTPSAALLFLVWLGIWTVLSIRGFIDGPSDRIPFVVGATAGGLVAVLLRALRHRLGNSLGKRAPGPWLRNDANYVFEGAGIIAVSLLSFVVADRSPFLGVWVGGMIVIGLHWFLDARRAAIEAVARHEAEASQ